MLPDLEPRLLPPLVDGEVELHLAERSLADPARNRSAQYRWEIRIGISVVGNISLRLGHSEYIEKYAGHIGYGIDAEHRGHHYAARAVKLVLPIAKSHDFRVVWITCNPENVASRRTCELAGGQLIDIVDLPPEIDMYKEGERQKCRYRITL
ncbi:MAG TPA: GNAT family N-acetyltransferase [Kofleriaceae bacterium]|nr:GNAT family N-acetyltransferase [Kofleriaceae bacterium]